MLAISLVRSAVSTLGEIAYGLYLTVKDWVCNLFRPKPLESEIDDLDYYHPTEEREKLYDKTDGEYISFKEIKHKKNQSKER